MRKEVKRPEPATLIDRVLERVNESEIAGDSDQALVWAKVAAQVFAIFAQTVALDRAMGPVPPASRNMDFVGVHIEMPDMEVR